MAVTLRAVIFDSPDPAVAGRFWARLLDREEVSEPGGILLPGSPTQVGLRFIEPHGSATGRRLHLHVTSTDLGERDATVRRVVELGGRHHDAGQLPAEQHIVLADPEGNEFCVIEPGNAYLAGWGRLGEVACDGTREVGQFWSAVLGWPLVWDRDEETAIQSPAGGTRIAWGGPPLAEKPGPNPQRFELASDDLAADLDRLVGLGAGLRHTDPDGAILADPDGNEFRLTG